MMRGLSFGIAALLAGVCGIAYADTVTLTDGSVREGTVVKEDAEHVTLEVRVGGMRGRVTIPRHEVAAIRKSAPAEDLVEAQAAKLRAAAEALTGAGAGDAWVALGDFYAERTGYSVQARAAYERAIEAHTDHATARKALGYTKTAAGWEALDSERRARGLVPLGEAWVKPAERAWIIDRRHEEETEELRIGPRRADAFTQDEVQRRLDELREAERFAQRQASLQAGEDLLSRYGYFGFDDGLYIGNAYAPYYVDGVGISYGDSSAFFGTVGYGYPLAGYPVGYGYGYGPYVYADPHYTLQGGPRTGSAESFRAQEFYRTYGYYPGVTAGTGSVSVTGGTLFSSYPKVTDPARGVGGVGYPDGSFNRLARPLPAHTTTIGPFGPGQTATFATLGSYYYQPYYSGGTSHAALSRSFQRQYGYSPGIVYGNKKFGFAFGTNFSGGYGYPSYGNGYYGGSNFYIQGGNKNFRYSVGFGGFSGYRSGGFGFGF